MRTLKSIISMISEFLDVSFLSTAKYFYLRRPQDPSHNPGKPPNHFSKIWFSHISKNGNLLKVWESLKRWGQKHHEVPSNYISEDLEHGINIFQNLRNEISVIWDHWIFESLKLWNQETKKLRNSETKKPRNQETKKPRSQGTKKPRNQESSNLSIFK